MNADAKSKDPKELKTVKCDRQLFSARFSPCGQFLASGAMDRVVMRWQVKDNDLVPLPPLSGSNGWVQSIAFHPSEKQLFITDTWGRLSCSPIEGDTPAPAWVQPAAHDGAIRRIAVSPDGKRLGTCGADRFVRIWRATDGLPAAKFEHTSDVFALENKHYVTLFVLAHSADGEPVVHERTKCARWVWCRWSELPEPLFQPVATLRRTGFVPPDAV